MKNLIRLLIILSLCLCSQWSIGQEASNFYTPEINPNHFNTKVFNDGDVINYNNLIMYYMIMESTKAEYVSVGSNGNILRWSPAENPKKQTWNIYPQKDSDGNIKYRIQSLADKKFMTIHHATGSIYIDKDLKNDSQLFEFKKTNKGKVNIVCPNGENVGVGWDGNILRWESNNEKNQEFILIPVEFKARSEEAKITDGEKAYKPNKIPTPDYEYSPDGPVHATEKYLISEDLIPATLINQDSKYASKIDQIEQSPYYYLVRRQYYFPVPIDIPAEAIYSKTVIREVTFSEKHFTQIKNYMSMAIEASISGSYSAATASLNASFEKSTEVINGSEEFNSEANINKVVFSLTAPEKTDIKIITWQLMDEYSLYDFNGNEVADTRWVSESLKFTKTYPNNDIRLGLKTVK